MIGGRKHLVEARCESCGSAALCSCRVYLAAYGIPVAPLGCRVDQASFPLLARWPGFSS